MRLVGAREAKAIRAGARVRVAGASSTLHIDWAGIRGAKLLTGRKGEGKVLRIRSRLSIGEDKWLSNLPNRDFTHDKRLFYYIRNSVLRLLVPFLL